MQYKFSPEVTVNIAIVIVVKLTKHVIACA